MAPPMCHGLLYILIYNVVYILIRIASHGRSRRGPARADPDGSAAEAAGTSVSAPETHAL